jgi:hypothetical protein
MPSRDYFDFDEIDNAIDNLEMVAHFLSSSFEMKWKWVCITLYQALYGLAIAALRGGDARLTVYDKRKDSGKAIALQANKVSPSIIASCFGVSEEKVNEWLANPWLISFDEAIARLQREENFQPLDFRPLILSDDERRSLERLSKEFRNEFEHFSPKRWAIAQSEFPKIVEDVLRVINYIGLESQFLTMSNPQEKKLKTAISRIEHLTRNKPSLNDGHA